MIIDRDGNQVIDEAAISITTLVSALEEHIAKAAKAEVEVEELRIEICRLNEELNRKQDIINQIQTDDYFRVNYPENNQ